MSNAYLHVTVNERLKQYLTINTHKGLFTYTPLPYRIACAPSQFQAVMDQILQRSPCEAYVVQTLLINWPLTRNCERVHMDFLEK